MLKYGEIDDIFPFLNDTEIEIFDAEFEKHAWTLNAGEVYYRQRGIPIRSFWYKELKNTLIEDLFVEKIETILNAKIKTTRIYGNGQSHGQTAWVHVDDNDNDNICGSVVYYPHKNWMPHLGGHLIFVENDEVVASVFPKSNYAVMFNSAMPHCALEPTVYCLDMRISVAFKFKVVK